MCGRTDGKQIHSTHSMCQDLCFVSLQSTVTLKSINMTEGSFGVQVESLYAVKWRSRATLTNSYDFAGSGMGWGGGGITMGYKEVAKVSGQMSSKPLNPL